MTATAWNDSPVRQYDLDRDRVNVTMPEGEADVSEEPRVAVMPGAGLRMESPYLGEICWDFRSEILFPAGLPGFEQQRRMIPVEIPSQRPLVYLQSADAAGVCFLTLPVLTIDRGFNLSLSDDDCALLDLDGRQPVIGTDILCLALLVPFECTVQSNLGAPIVINLHNNHGIQAVSTAAGATFRLSRYDGWETVC